MAPPQEESATADIKRLPVEIQHKIFTEALCKPHVHFMVAKPRRVPGTYSWVLAYTKADESPAKRGRSGYRLVDEIRTVSLLAARAARLGTTEKARLPFPVATANFDAATDIVCFEFEGKPDNWRNYVWARESQFLPITFDRETTAAQLGAIKKVAITFNQGVNRVNRHPEPFFRCVNHGNDNCQPCPDELVGFLDCFPNLEAFYIIIRRGSCRCVQPMCAQYAKRFFSRKSLSYPSIYPVLAPQESNPCESFYHEK